MDQNASSYIPFNESKHNILAYQGKANKLPFMSKTWSLREEKSSVGWVFDFLMTT
jgi:hypothetical protein